MRKRRKKDTNSESIVVQESVSLVGKEVHRISWRVVVNLSSFSKCPTDYTFRHLGKNLPRAVAWNRAILPTPTPKTPRPHSLSTVS